jgi:hypothetical protein
MDRGVAAPPVAAVIAAATGAKQDRRVHHA